MAFFEFPRTRTYDSDLGWLINEYKKIPDAQAATEEAKNQAINAKNAAEAAQTGAEAAEASAEALKNDTSQIKSETEQIKTETEQIKTEAAQLIEDTTEELNNRLSNAISAVTTDTEVTDIRVWFNGQTSSTAGDAVRGQASLLNDQIIKMSNVTAPISEAANRLLANVNDICIFNALTSLWDDLPEANANCAFINLFYTSNYKEQFAIVNNTGNMYERIVHRNGSIYRNWTGVKIADIQKTITDRLTFYSAIGDLSTQSERHLSKLISENYIFTATTAYFDDTPRGSGGVFISLHGTTTYRQQFFIESVSGMIFNRVVNASNGTIYRDWTANPEQQRFLGKKVWCDGDSIMWGRTTSSGRATVTIPQNIASRIPATVYNAAVGGDTIAYRSDGGSIYSRIMAADLTEYDYFVISGGTNDYGFGVELGDINSTSNTTFYGAYKAIIERIFAQNYKARIMLVTPTMRNYVARGGTWHTGNAYNMDGDGGYTLKELNDAIHIIAERYSLPVYDSYLNQPVCQANFTRMLVPNDDNLGHYIHLTDESYKLYGDSIASEFLRVF